DGAAVEIIGLLASTVKWLSRISSTDDNAYQGVHIGGRVLTYIAWYQLICNNFERHFYIPTGKPSALHTALDTDCWQLMKMMMMYSSSRSTWSFFVEFTRIALDRPGNEAITTF